MVVLEMSTPTSVHHSIDFCKVMLQFFLYWLFKSIIFHVIFLFLYLSISHGFLLISADFFPAQVGSDARENVRHWFTRSDASRRDKLLACGAFIVAELRLQVLEETEFTCSAGIAHNKVEIFIIL